MIAFVSADVLRSEENDTLKCGLYLAEPVVNGEALKRRLDTVHSCTVYVFRDGAEPVIKSATDNGSGFYVCELSAAERPPSGAEFVLTVGIKEQATSTEHQLEGTGRIDGTYTQLVLH